MNLQKLEHILPGNVYDALLKGNKNLTNNLRLAHFLSQVAHESGNFRVLYENLNYSASGLLKVFPRYFNATTAVQFARKPQLIANRVYANRIGNGNEASGDGWNYRGRGYLQVTGRANYKAFSEYIGEDCEKHPDLVATKYPLDSAIWFFDRNKLWTLCDKGEENVPIVSGRVNGGTNGLQDRLNKFRSFMKYLNS
jgi:putative chitinase